MILRATTAIGAILLLGLGSVATDASAREGAAHRSLSKTRAKAAPQPDPERATHEANVTQWLRAHAPGGTEVSMHEGEPQVVYETKAADTLPSIARALVPLSETYLWSDFAEELVKANPALRAGVKAGMRLDVPNLLREPPVEGHLGSPEDGAIRGVYVRGSTAGGHAYVKLLDKMVEHGMNAIVLDSKDTDGILTYPSEVPLAVETGATKDAPIADLSRTIRFAHARGIHVVMRVSCFHDEWMQHHEGKAMSIRGKWGGVYPIGWLDPANTTAHAYLVALAKEAMDSGADEIELDYVRYPVIGIKNADFHLADIGKTKTEVIRDFVHEVHTVTHARGVPLSLDIFGVVAQGKRVDIDGLGQDIVLLGPECEALSPMLYPSHYAKGFLGFEIPGNHPELVGIGTKGTATQLALEIDGRGAKTAIRPWVQAVNYESPDYGPQYLSHELRSADDNGATGWLMWNPSQDYSTAWAAVPKRSGSAVAAR